MDSVWYERKATREAASILDEHGIAVPVETRDLLLALMGAAYLRGVQSGVDSAKAVALKAATELLTL